MVLFLSPQLLVAWNTTHVVPSLRWNYRSLWWFPPSPPFLSIFFFTSGILGIIGNRTTWNSSIYSQYYFTCPIASHSHWHSIIFSFWSGDACFIRFFLLLLEFHSANRSIADAISERATECCILHLFSINKSDDAFRSGRLIRVGSIIYCNMLFIVEIHFREVQGIPLIMYPNPFTLGNMYSLQVACLHAKEKSFYPYNKV